jgi:hypothetical protein
MIPNNLGARIAAAKTAVSIASAWRRLGLADPPPEGNRVVRPPDREDESECFSIFLAKDGWQRFKDHKSGASGDVFDFVELVVKEGRPAAIQTVLQWAGDTASLSGHGATSSPPPEPPTSPGKTRISSDERARLSREFDRGRWPRFTDPTQADIEQIARIRKLDPCAVHAINATGMLQVADHNGRRVFVIREGVFAQWRPLSGEPCDGENKALNFKGSEGAFIGRCLLGSDTQAVLLTEGVVGLLESTALIGIAENGWHWTALVATSSGSRFSTATDLLTALAGRRVRIVADAGKAGADAAASWCADLHAAGASVDFFDIPAGCRDLGPIAQNPSSHAELIHRLFTF